MRVVLGLLIVGRLWAALSVDCAPCHREIYEKYSRTTMARSTAMPAGMVAGASIGHAGFRYQVDGSLRLRFDKPGGPSGIKQLSYGIGSGATARSYLWQHDGYLFQAPIAHYTAANTWDLAPGYKGYAYPYVTRPVTTSCLNCHASFLQPVVNTQNRYADPPFLEAGIACERCHGPGEEHIRRRGAVVNPSRLSAQRRDDICSQCHLAGEVRIMRPGADWKSYRPGDLLSDSTTVFLRAGGNAAMTVTGHVEKLAQSRCKQAARDKLWCGSCHDPHDMPAARTKAAWFRDKCVNCHKPADCRARRNEDCVSCHMPKLNVVDAQHVVYTDHSIPRRPRVTPQATVTDLKAFGNLNPDQRDMALAYAAVPALRTRATPMLEAAFGENPDDVEVLVHLAEAYRNSGRDGEALPLYRRAAELDRAQVTARVGLGAVLFQQGKLTEAARVWEEVLVMSPGLDLVRTNLAMAYWKVGDIPRARRTLQMELQLSPAFPPANDLWKRLSAQFK